MNFGTKKNLDAAADQLICHENLTELLTIESDKNDDDIGDSGDEEMGNLVDDYIGESIIGSMKNGAVMDG